MKEILLSKNGKKNKGKFVALVDDEDYSYLNQFNWTAGKLNQNYFALRRIVINGKQKMILMHREIMGAKKDEEIDHIDFNTLNNQKSNLRICNRRQNLVHRRARSKSGYLGVKVEGKYKNLYSASITVNREKIYLGLYKTPEEAALAFNKASIKYNGEFAYLNNIEK